MTFAALTIDINARLANLEKGLDRAVQITQNASRRIEVISRGFRFLGGGLGGLAAGALVREAIDLADAYTRIGSSLRIVTNSSAEAAALQERLFAVAQRTRQGLGDLASTYTAFARNASQLGIGEDRLLALTETISQAIALSGASAESARAALIQLGQGIASGVLRGEELNSVMEQTPRLAMALAEGLGVPIGRLRELGKEGELTADRVVSALERAAPKLRQEFQNVTPTVRDAFTQMGNSVGRLIDRINDATGATSILSRAISGAAKAIDALVDATQPSVEKSLAGVERMLQQRLQRAMTADPSGRLAEGLRRDLERVQEQIRATAGPFGDAFMVDAAAAAESVQRALQPTKEYTELLYRLSGVNKDFHKDLQVIKTEYDAGRISLEEYRKQVAQLIRLQTQQGKDAAKERKLTDFKLPEIEQRVNDLTSRVLADNAVERARDTAVVMERLDRLFFEGVITVQQYDAAVSELFRTVETSGRDGEKALREQADAVRELIDPARKYVEQLLQITQLEERGLLSVTEAALARAALTERIVESTRDLNEAVREGVDITRDLGLVFNSALEDAIVNMEELSDVAKALFKDLARLTARRLIIEPLLGAATSGLSNLFGGSGMVVNGPEGRVGTVELPRELRGGKSAGSVPAAVTINQTFNFGDANPNPAQLRAWGQQIKAEAKFEILQSMRNGGVFAR